MCDCDWTIRVRNEVVLCFLYRDANLSYSLKLNEKIKIKGSYILSKSYRKKQQAHGEESSFDAVFNLSTYNCILYYVFYVLYNVRNKLNKGLVKEVNIISLIECLFNSVHLQNSPDFHLENALKRHNLVPTNKLVLKKNICLFTISSLSSNSNKVCYNNFKQSIC